MKLELVQDWMSSNVITADVKTTVPVAYELMKQEEIRRLPVMKNNHLVGIVTIGDIREAKPSDATTLSVWELNYLLSQLTLDKIMTTKVVTLHPEDTIGTAARTMLENRISGLPIVDEKGELVGMITESDIFSMVVLNEWSEARQPNAI